jgi:hypothetical protein
VEIAGQDVTAAIVATALVGTVDHDQKPTAEEG